MLEPRPLPESFSFLHFFGGLAGTPTLAAYRGLLHHFQGIYGITENMKHGESALALRAVSFWTADSIWHVRLDWTVVRESLARVRTRFFFPIFFCPERLRPPGARARNGERVDGYHPIPRVTRRLAQRMAVQECRSKARKDVDVA